jgi:hypothetical protein
MLSTYQWNAVVKDKIEMDGHLVQINHKILDHFSPIIS